MSHPLLIGAAALLAAAVPGAASAPAVGESGRPVAQLSIQQRIIVRIQRQPAANLVTWVEKKGPKCVAAERLAGVLIREAGAIDLVLEGGERVRARLDDDCPSLTFYGGFYLKPNRDGQVCADRDVIRSRSGRMCEIDDFKRLVAKK